METFEALKGLTHQLSSAATAEDIGRALLSLAQGFGLTNLLIVDASKTIGQARASIVFASAGRSQVDAFDADAPIVKHPASRRAMESDRPFLMSQLRQMMGEGQRPSWWHSLPGEMQHKDGLVVPVHEDHELVWAACFTGPDPDLSQTAQSLLAAAVHAAHTRYTELEHQPAPRHPLSPREAECLRWVADGKTDFEIGKILEISPRTVRFHVNNAKVKLGVATRIQAVAKRAGGPA